MFHTNPGKQLGRHFNSIDSFAEVDPRTTSLGPGSILHLTLQLAMADNTDPRLLSCIPCMDRGRICDGTRDRHGVCGKCNEVKELFCSWYILDKNRLASNSTEQSFGDIRNPWLPSFPEGRGKQLRPSDTDPKGPIESRQRIFELQGLLWILNSPELRHLIEEPRTRNLIQFDVELRTLFLAIDPAAGVGHQELATAILKTSLPQGENAIINSCNSAIGTIQRTISGMDQSQECPLAGPLGVSICLARLFEFYDVGTTKQSFHLAALRNITNFSGPLSPVSKTVILSSLYHTAIGSTFSFSKTAQDLPLFYINELRERISESTLTPSNNQDYTTADSYLGVPLFLLDFAFQIAKTRHEIAVTGLSQETHARLLRIRDFLTRNDSSDGLDILRPHCPRTERAQERLMRLYWAALLVLLRKTVDKKATRVDLQPVVASALDGIETVDVTEHDKTIIWPLLVLYFATQPVSRGRIWSIFEQLRSLVTVENFESTLDFLRRTEDSNYTTPENVIEVLLKEDVDEINLF